MTIEKEKRFLLLLSSFVQGDGVTKSEVLDYIEEHDWIILSAEDLQIRKNRNESIWRNDLAYIRKHLAMEGLFIADERSNWSITDEGVRFLISLFQEVLYCSGFSKIKDAAVLAAKEIISFNTMLQIINHEEFSEGKISYVKHIVRERNRGLINAAKAHFQTDHQGKLYCEVCGFDFYKTYGEIGYGFIEVHHTKPISTMQEGEKTRVQDMAILCSNCHSMIHRKKPWITVELLRETVKKNK